MSEEDEKQPDGVKHYESLDDFPQERRDDLKKYWYRRHELFSKYDEGIWMTESAWYGVTQEAVATKIAEHVANYTPADKKILIDAFAGAGGNTIAFARSGRWTRVYAIEEDAATMACARHNAKVYGVHNKITWFRRDCFDVIRGALGGEMGQHAVIFGSPPWGGPKYREVEIFDLSKMQPYSLMDMYEPFARIYEHVVLYLPRTADLKQLAAAVKEESKVDVVHYCTRGFSRALCAYLGPFDSA